VERSAEMSAICFIKMERSQQTILHASIALVLDIQNSYLVLDVVGKFDMKGDVCKRPA